MAASDFELGAGHGLALVGVADDYALDPLVQVDHVVGEAEDGHDLRGGRDVEAVPAGEAVAGAAEADDDVAEGAVVEVDDAPPGYAAGVEKEGVAVVEVVVDHRRQEVVGLGDAVHVAGEVEVDVLRGDYLGVAAAGRAALHAEVGAKGGFADGQGGLLAEAGEGVGQSDGDGGLALAAPGGGDGGDENKASIGLRRFLLKDGERELGDVLAVEVDDVGIESQLLGDLGYRPLFYALFDFQVGLHVYLAR